MSVLVACECGQSFELRDEFRGRSVRCPHCARIATAVDARPADPIFGREVFLLRQKAFALNEKYFVNDDKGQPLLFVERPARFLRGLLAVFVAIAAVFIMVMLLTAITTVAPKALAAVIAALMPLFVFPVFLLVLMAMLPKRHV